MERSGDRRRPQRSSGGFGFAWCEAFCTCHGAEIVVMNAGKVPPEAEMVGASEEAPLPWCGQEG